ncbi:MAG: AGE family epimerase/isomerase [Sphingomonadales bacterium]|nr:AGE family epimerase/isomerase [Sphingomonadales bacterium]
MDIFNWLCEPALRGITQRGIGVDVPGYVERFGWDGSRLDPGFKRVRVTARQCYVFSHAAIGGMEGALEAARMGADLLLQRGIRDDGQFVSRFASDGTVLDPATDLYDVAFGLFAMAWWYRVSGDERAVVAAQRSIVHLREDLRSPSGRGYLAREGDAGPHQQNPHMHLFEAAIFLAAFTGKAEFAELADELFGLAEAALFDVESGTLAEFFDADWRRGGAAGPARIEPGHHYEWVWLLNRYGALAGRQRAFEIADRLFDFARAYGHDEGRTGLIVDAVDENGAVLQSDLRIWPNLEYLKALVSMRERHGDGAHWDEDVVEATVRRIHAYFLTRQADGPASVLPDGLWIDYLDGVSLKPKGDHVPASTLYHIMFAFTELLRHRAGHEAFSGKPW